MMHLISMASITKRGQQYYASFIGADGNRKQLATKETNIYEAQTKADLLELPYHLSKVGSDAILLHLLNSDQADACRRASNLTSKLEELKNGDTDIEEVTREALDLKNSLHQGFEAARYPYANAVRRASSFTGMPPEADLEIRAGFSAGKKHGSGYIKLHLATRLLCEMEASGSPLKESAHRMVWERAWSSLGDAILQLHSGEQIPTQKLVRMAATLMEQSQDVEYDNTPDTNETRLYWYMACCFKRNKQIPPRRVIHHVSKVWTMSKPTINRILSSWVQICNRYEKGFKFPLSSPGYDDLVDEFKSDDLLKKGRSTYFKI